MEVRVAVAAPTSILFLEAMVISSLSAEQAGLSAEQASEARKLLTCLLCKSNKNEAT
jgi:hypothetical protein